MIIQKVIVVCCLALMMACSQVQDKSNASQKVAEQNTQDYLQRDVRDDIFYFVMPDRFNNANPDNDMGSKKYAISRGGLDVTSKWAFHGGDMQGLEEKLDYLQEMGITAIWMTPILRNKAVQKDGFAHHGYWIVDFTQIDPHFGSNEDLKSLIDAAHARGMKIFFDIITNHTADVIKYRECHDDKGVFKPGLKHCEYKSLAQLEKGDTYTPFLPENAKGQKYPEWLNDPKYYHNQGDTTFQGENSLYGDFNGLDDLNTEHPDVLAGMIDIYKNIISEFKPDGFRVDTVRHVQLPFWQAFGPAIMEHAKSEGIPNFHIFGEVYDPNPAHLAEFTTAGKLPAVLDFGFQQVAADVFYRGKNATVIRDLFVADDYYNDHDSQADLLLTFLGNHDMGRPGYFINQDMTDISASEKMQRSILSHAFMYMSRGIPVVYYGDEQGFTGDGNDVDAREDMFPSQVASYNDNVLMGTSKTTADDNFDTDHPIYSSIKTFAQLRLAHEGLRRGIHINRHFDQESKAFAFSRVSLEDQVEYLVAFNGETTEQTINVATTSDGYETLYGEADIAIENDNVKMVLEPLSFILLKSRTPMASQPVVDFTLASIEDAKDTDLFLKASYQLQESEFPFDLFEVKTEYKDRQGNYVLAAKDYTSPFSAYLPKGSLSENSNIRVTISNMAGEQKTKVFDLAR